MRRYAAISLLSALLLFLVQPLMARAILPWFGGAASVWTTSLLFYQALLFGGYAYAHVGRRLGPGRQAIVHLVLLFATVVLLPITPSEAWKPVGAEAPTLRLLGLLTASVGGPYLLLAGTTPLLHDWFALEAPNRSPYPLYAVSNVGSLLALLIYPAVMGPLLPVSRQGVWWSWAYVGLVVASAWLAWRFLAARPQPATPAAVSDAPAPTLLDRTLWVLLAACGSGLLLAITNQITMDVAAVPLLWILPLAVYLVTFILAFAGLYRRGTWGALLVLGIGGSVLLWAGGFALPVAVQIGLGLGVLLAGCMVCHGELARAAPAPGHLTLFYLMIAGGGALGGLLVAVVAPIVLSDFYELPAFVIATYALLLVVMRRDAASAFAGRDRARSWAVLVSVLVLGAAAFVGPSLRRTAGTVAAERSFYGVLRVQDRPEGLLSEMRVLRHGRIFHGAQFLEPERSTLPTAYFTEGSGVALAIGGHAKRVAGEPLRIGVIGLGVGTIAAWGEPGDRVRFYELDPVAERLARTHFTFLAESAAEVDVVLGDGRLSLERDVAASPGQPLYDVLVVDAFAGDAVPVHLLTRESAELFRRALEPDGVIVFQITNRHVDLERVVRGLARAEGMEAVRIDQDPPRGTGAIPNSWMLVAEEGDDLPDGARTGARDPVLWTDDYSNLLRVLR